MDEDERRRKILVEALLLMGTVSVREIADFAWEVLAVAGDACKETAAMREAREILEGDDPADPSLRLTVDMTQHFIKPEGN